MRFIYVGLQDNLIRDHPLCMCEIMHSFSAPVPPSPLAAVVDL